MSLWLAGAAAIMPVGVYSLPGPKAPASSTDRFQPPSTHLRLTRTLRRPLPGGEQVLTRRSYEIRIVPDGAGFRVDGRLVSVEVEAPQKLGALADLERKRPDDGLFPMRLDAKGMLLPGTDPPSGEAVRKATERASREIGAMKLPASEKSQALAFVGQFRERPGRSPWPLDLFHPAPGHRREIRDVPLPDGTLGHVTTAIDATRTEPLGLLSSFTRTVTTDLGGDTRTTHESWTLGPA